MIFSVIADNEFAGKVPFTGPFISAFDTVIDTCGNRRLSDKSKNDTVFCGAQHNFMVSEFCFDWLIVGKFGNGEVPLDITFGTVTEIQQPVGAAAADNDCVFALFQSYRYDVVVDGNRVKIITESPAAEIINHFAVEFDCKRQTADTEIGFAFSVTFENSGKDGMIIPVCKFFKVKAIFLDLESFCFNSFAVGENEFVVFKRRSYGSFVLLCGVKKAVPLSRQCVNRR